MPGGEAMSIHAPARGAFVRYGAGLVHKTRQSVEGQAGDVFRQVTSREQLGSTLDCLLLKY